MDAPAPVDDVALSVALPVHDEAKVLVALHERLVATLLRTGRSFEIVFVDDGSTDATPVVLRALADVYPHVTVVRLSRNWGHGAALKAGIDLASGREVVVMDADLQDQPELIEKLVEERDRTGAEVVHVVRTSRPEGWWQGALFRVFHWAISRSSTYPQPRDTGSFGLMGPRALAEVRELSERLRYFPGLRAFVGFEQIGIPAPREARYDGRSRVGLGGLAQLAAHAFFAQSRAPALAFFWLSGLSLLAAVLLVVYGIGAQILGADVGTWTWVVTVQAAFAAVIVLGLALVFEYLARIYEETRGRPVYVVDTVRRARRPGVAPRLAAPPRDSGVVRALVPRP